MGNVTSRIRYVVRVFFIAPVYLGSWLFWGAHAYGATQITAIDFKGTDDPSEITIQADNPLVFEREDNKPDKQVILEIKGATITDAVARKIDTSSFQSNVVLISPYAVEGDIVRVVIQLRDVGTLEIKQDGNSLKVLVARAAPPDTPAVVPPSVDIPTPSVEVPSAPAETPNPDSNSSSVQVPLTDFSEKRQSKRFTGTPITLQVRDADVRDVFRLIGEASGFSVVVSDGVKGKVSLSLVSVPWDQALDAVLHTLHLAADRNQNVLRVMTLADFTAEKLDEMKATQAAAVSTPKAFKVFPISHANITELQGMLSKFASPATVGELSGAGGVVQVDTRTNSLIVHDLPLQIERMSKLVQVLDVESPQVLIEAKVVEASESFAKTLSGSLGLSDSSASPSLFASIAGGNPVDSLIGSPGVFASGSALSASTVNSSSFGFSPNLSFLPGSPRLSALLTWGESESQLKIVSSPKTVVLNKQLANIVQGTPVLVPGTSFVAGVGSVPVETIQNANVSLTVRPTVTHDGSVLLDLSVAKDELSNLANSGKKGVGSRNMQTMVLVESGSTLVIGGIYTMGNLKTSSGIPFLRKIPIIGALFGSDSETTVRSELFIFVTPRILSPREAGLAGA